MYKKTLYEQLFDEYDNHKGFWSYYGNDTNNPFTSKEAAKRFLEEYFICGSKTEAIRSWVQDKNIRLEARNMHMVVAFFIGVMLQRKIDDSIAIESACGDMPYPFAYYWFITCLAHDFGYAFEEGISEKDMEAIKIRNEFYLKGVSKEWKCVSGRGKEKITRINENRRVMYKGEGMQISMCVPSSLFLIPRMICHKKRDECRGCVRWNECDNKYKCVKRIKYSNGIEIKKARYSFEIIEKYFRYRILEQGKIDHGIVGGDKLFSDLKTNFKKEYSENLQRGRFCDFENNVGKHFSCEHFKVFWYIANCIAAHNIFMEEESSNDTMEESIHDKYDRHGLECLFKENFRKISYQDDPLLFILCVADTIEPTKRFDDLEACKILGSMSVDYDVEENKLVVHVDSDFVNKHCSIGPGREKYIKYENGVNSLGTWCDIEAKVIVSDSINKKLNG